MALQSTTALATVTLQAATPTVTFSGIPNTYRDLVLVCSVSGTVNDQGVRLRLNSDSASNYSTIAMGGTGAFSPGQYSFSTTTTHALIYAIHIGVNTNGIRTPITSQILDYAATDKHKPILTRANGQNNSTTETVALASRWASLAPVSSVDILLASGNFAAGSTFSLYGRIA
jgi:hypothetical protein